MTGRDVDRAGAGIHRDEIGGQDDGGARQKRMLRADAFDLAAGKRLHRLARSAPSRSRRKTAPPACRAQQRASPIAPSRSEFLHDVKLFWMNGDREIRRQRPWRRRPDDDARLAFQRAGHDRKLHVNRRVLAVLVFHFGFGQRGLRAGAPEDRLHRFVNQPFLHEDGEGAQDLRFVRRDRASGRDVPNRRRRRAA